MMATRLERRPFCRSRTPAGQLDDLEGGTDGPMPPAAPQAPAHLRGPAAFDADATGETAQPQRLSDCHPTTFDSNPIRRPATMNILDPGLRNALRTLKLTGMLDILDARLVQTRDGGYVPEFAL
jgi:hypothetical protein